MNETTRMLAESAGRIFEDMVDRQVQDDVEAGGFAESLWQTLESSGFTRLLLPEAAGGSGLGLAELLVLLREAGRHAAPVPLAEHALALPVLAALGIDVGDGVVTVVDGDFTLHPGAGGARIEGRSEPSPFARHAALGLLLLEGPDGPAAACLPLATPPAGVRVLPAMSIAGEAADTIVLDGAPIRIHRLDQDVPLRTRLALARAAQMSGALERILEMAVGYALERSQFGRPIARFQAIQHQLAILAGEVAAATRSVDAARERCERGEDFEIWAAVAKARVGEAVGPGAEIAHQVHGAMGFTHEHMLHRFTRRLWAWRDDYGSETDWQAELGSQVLGVGADHLWAFMSAA